ncbi:hypothetical protein TREPR_2006 [Treponema primitia ZAS-2]|uniref:Extracellular solute-binding protein n=1 Tax=Treponema primitia (strain ATCC BAA-887 / DSM 12427 / ZAS-2) TaxID=545694 RepID=F5YKD0_TREPZ|nr:hypothetical protein [Treponema primitia]AEF86386.1 hypothetical protein TREPR_2006 [Treponema primitia ZAS-2]
MKNRIITRKKLPRILLGGLILLAFAAGALILIPILTEPKVTWYVAPEYEKQWGEILARASPPPPFMQIQVYKKERSKKREPDGIIITRETPELPEPVLAAGPKEALESLRIIPIDSGNREYRGARALAFNPWMVYRKYEGPQLTRARLDRPGGEGTILIPGAEPAAVEAWLAQLLQESPGVFPEDRETWDKAEDRLFLDRRFQRGALSYSWFDIWIALFQEGPSWVYAPLGKIRELPPDQAASLDAAQFPIPGNWNRYGMQADILWAIPKAPGTSERVKKVLEDANFWLEKPEIQALIADTLGWVPAHPQGKPYDTIAREAQVVWFSSSFIWQGAKNVQEGYR